MFRWKHGSERKRSNVKNFGDTNSWTSRLDTHRANLSRDTQKGEHTCRARSTATHRRKSTSATEWPFAVVAVVFAIFLNAFDRRLSSDIFSLARFEHLEANAIWLMAITFVWKSQKEFVGQNNKMIMYAPISCSFVWIPTVISPLSFEPSGVATCLHCWSCRDSRQSECPWTPKAMFCFGQKQCLFAFAASQQHLSTSDRRNLTLRFFERQGVGEHHQVKPCFWTTPFLPLTPPFLCVRRRCLQKCLTNVFLFGRASLVQPFHISSESSRKTTRTLGTAVPVETQNRQSHTWRHVCTREHPLGLASSRKKNHEKTFSAVTCGPAAVRINSTDTLLKKHSEKWRNRDTATSFHGEKLVFSGFGSSSQNHRILSCSNLAAPEAHRPNSLEAI